MNSNHTFKSQKLYCTLQHQNKNPSNASEDHYAFGSDYLTALDECEKKNKLKKNNLALLFPMRHVQLEETVELTHTLQAEMRVR